MAELEPAAGNRKLLIGILAILLICLIAAVASVVVFGPGVASEVQAAFKQKSPTPTMAPAFGQANTPTPTLQPGAVISNTGVVSIVIYEDVNGDGVKNTGETGIKDVEIRLAIGSLEKYSQLTDQYGEVYFDKVVSGKYDIVVNAIEYQAVTDMTVEVIKGEETDHDIGLKRKVALPAPTATPTQPRAFGEPLPTAAMTSTVPVPTATKSPDATGTLTNTVAAPIATATLTNTVAAPTATRTPTVTASPTATRTPTVASSATPSRTPTTAATTTRTPTIAPSATAQLPPNVMLVGGIRWEMVDSGRKPGNYSINHIGYAYRISLVYTGCDAQLITDTGVTKVYNVDGFETWAARIPNPTLSQKQAFATARLPFLPGSCTTWIKNW